MLIPQYYGDVPIVRRSGWGALPPKRSTKLQHLPLEYVIIAHTAGPYCKTKDQCIEIVRNIQQDHVWVKGWEDIGYNFLVGGDGLIYEGCGWDNEGSHSYRWNKKGFGIAFTGDYRFDEPTQEQIKALNKLLDLGVKQNKLIADYKVLGHRQVIGSISPGEKLYNLIKTWKHWSEFPNVSETRI